MLRAAITFFLLALLALIFGAYGLAGISLEVGRTILLVFLVFSVLSLFLGILFGKRKHRP